MQVKSQFEGDFSFKFHLVPTLFSRTDAKDRMVKAQYGSWMFGAFRLLAKLKDLRGGAFELLSGKVKRRPA